jgi:hypothetical protein
MNMRDALTCDPFGRRRVRIWRRPFRLLWVLALFGGVYAFAQPSSAKPILVSAPDSTRALAFDAVQFTVEPISARASSPLYKNETATRVMLFALNLSLASGNPAASVVVDAEDSAHRHYPLTVEYAGKIPGLEWIVLIEVRMDETMGNLGDVLIGITNQGVASNRVRLGIGHVGGGLADDPGSVPTPARGYVISGKVNDDNGVGLDNVNVTLKNESDGSTRTVITSAGGTFAFTDVSPGFNYTTSATNTSLFAFTRREANHLNSDFSFTFNGVLRTYTVSGFIADRAQHAVGGIDVTLSGSVVGTTTTDANGNYAFSNLTAGRDYQVAAANPNYFVSPGPQTFHLLSDARGDFTAIRFYVLSGKVTNTTSKGLFGVIMTLNGPETGWMRTGSDGSYSFTVTTSGNYSLTPSKEQDYYHFSPQTKSLVNLSDHQTNNFTGEIVIDEPTEVLEFNGEPMNVDYSFFWPPDTNVGHFFWEFWAMPGENNYDRYLLTDGYGGAHTILFGFNSGPGQHYTLMGNVWIGSQVFYFNSDDGPSPGEWGHYAVGWDGQSIITYYDGVPVGKQLFTGPRVSTGTYNGATLLMVGGSGHQNHIGRIAQVRGFEENNPRESSPESSFSPETIFSVDGQLLSYYFRPATYVADLSNGYNGKQHVGWPRNAEGFYFDPCRTCPGPQFVFDPTAPNFVNPEKSPPPVTQIDQAPSTPNGARIFDSFSRDNSTHILGGLGGLGRTERGSAGVKVWQTPIQSEQPQAFGILSGHGVVLTDDTSLAWVPAGAANLIIKVNRGPIRFGSGTNTGLSFRVAGKNDFFFAYTSDDLTNPTGPKILSVGYYQSGARTIIASGLSMPLNWITLAAVTSPAGDIKIFGDDALVFSTTNSLFASATGAGLFNNGPGLGLTNRWDNFTVLDAAH